MAIDRWPRRRNVLSWVVVVLFGSSAAITYFLEVRFDSVFSDSMAPRHPAGSVVVTIPIPTWQIWPGHVVMLPIPGGSGQSFVHRVVKSTPSPDGLVVITKGDANPRPDPWQLAIISRTTPVVIATIPLVGHLSVFTSQIWFQLGLAFSALGLVAVSIFRAFRVAVARTQVEVLGEQEELLEQNEEV